MAELIRLEVPTDIAQELIQEGEAVRARGTRGGPAAEFLSVALDVANDSSSIVTLALATPVARKIVLKMYNRRRADTASLQIGWEGEEPRTIPVRSEDPEDIEAAVVALMDVLKSRA